MNDYRQACEIWYEDRPQICLQILCEQLVLTITNMVVMQNFEVIWGRIKVVVV